MTTETELIFKRNTALKISRDAQQELDDFRAKPKIKVYKNRPVIIDGEKVYACCLHDGVLSYYMDGANSYTNGGLPLVETKNWQPDYDRPSLLNWRPVDETIPEHREWLVRMDDGFLGIIRRDKNFLLKGYKTGECLPL